MGMNNIVRTALERYQIGIDGDWDNRERDDEDRKFYKGGNSGS
jgi:hypothetical protein